MIKGNFHSDLHRRLWSVVRFLFQSGMNNMWHILYFMRGKKLSADGDFLESVCMFWRCCLLLECYLSLIMRCSVKLCSIIKCVRLTFTLNILKSSYDSLFTFIYILPFPNIKAKNSEFFEYQMNLYYINMLGKTLPKQS